MKVVLEHVTKRYPNRDKRIKEEVIAVSDLDFEIPDGKLIGLLGPSGCGKSTTLNLISGLTEPTEGKIYFGDDDITNLPPEKRGIGLVFQNYALYPHLTVMQNITFPLENLKGDQKMTKQQMADKAMEVAKLVQIESLMERKPSQMSGGQQQRVAIARALVKTPKVLLLDEPLSNLDARLRLQTREEIKHIQKTTGVTTIFVTHDQEEAMSISDFIVIMKSGTVQQIGKPQDVYDDPCNKFVADFLGTPQINMFLGQIKDNGIYIGEERIMDIKDHKDEEVYIGIRPEGFEIADDGKLTCDLIAIEVMGRDTSVVSYNKAFMRQEIRSIISSEDRPTVHTDKIKFNIKPNKILLFDKQSEERVYFEV